MASRNPLLPTLEQCMALTDEQCRTIQQYLDPDGVRFQKDWERKHQNELIRLYMTMMSFPHIEAAMRSKLDWCYKTYQNRFRDWLFPLDRTQREQTILELYANITGSNAPTPAASSQPPTQPRLLLPIRQIQPQPQQQPMMSPQQPQQQMSGQPEIKQEFFSIFGQYDANRSPAQDRMSISTMDTWTTGSASSVSTGYDDVFSNPRYSISTIATSNSSMSSGSRYAPPRNPLSNQLKPLKPPKHDQKTGIWNGVLRVIPCGIDHSRLKWDNQFPRCSVCGFSRWHALMLHARGIDLGTFAAAIKHMAQAGVERADFAGNFPIHFLMSAGVGTKYLNELLQIPGPDSAQNAFGQNPLHVFNPQDLGEELIPFLDFWIHASPINFLPGFLLTQRDIYGRTPLHALLHHPLDKNMYAQVFKIFPYAAHQLRSVDIAGRNTIQMMNEASMKIKSGSKVDYAKMQNGITEVKLFLDANGAQGEGYGFHEIARGGRGTTYLGFYQCRICNQTNAHSSSHLDQMKCACACGRDRNAPDETGMTPAHALVNLLRSSNHGERDESANQTYELFRVLIPPYDPTLREALHVLDPQGNSLIHNIATRGLDEILRYVLELEHPSRRPAMVNSCSKGPNGKDRSVLEAVQDKTKDTVERIKCANTTGDSRSKRRFLDEAKRVDRCKHILLSEGAELKPSVTTRWRISF